MKHIRALQKKEIVSVSDGKLLGKIKNVYFDDTGRINSIETEKKGSGISLDAKKEVYTVLWEDVLKDSEDVILVKNFIKGGLQEEKSKSENIYTKLQGYGAAALFLISILVLLKSCMG